MTIADIETLTRFLTKTNTVSLTAANLLILDNKYYEEITGRIIRETAGFRQQRGDMNYTSFPTFTISMSNGVQSYGLDDIETAGQRPLTIMGVEVLDEDGNSHPLSITSLREIRQRGFTFDSYQSTDGRPFQYEIRDNMLSLFPGPDNGVTVTLSNGLIVYYLRTADVFTSAQVSTGTKQPGFPLPWHDLMSYGPATDYAIANALPNANQLQAQYDKRMKEMLDFIAIRGQDDRQIMTGRSIVTNRRHRGHPHHRHF